MSALLKDDSGPPGRAPGGGGGGGGGGIWVQAVQAASVRKSNGCSLVAAACPRKADAATDFGDVYVPCDKPNEMLLSIVLASIVDHGHRNGNHADASTSQLKGCQGLNNG